MARIRLKKIISNKETALILQQLIQQLREPVAIADAKGKWLLGEPTATPDSFHNIEFEGKIIGKIYGSNAVKPLLDLIDFLVQREYERKKLGAEVLDLYREVNVMYSFAEKLAETIHPADIAKLTLAETKSSFKVTKGFITLKSSNEKIALIDEFNFSGLTSPLLNDKTNFYGKLIANQDGGIINNHSITPIETISILYTPLKVKDHILGTIILVNENNYQFTAADLKLLSTLSTQSASAIESAQLFEKNIREAREKEAAIRALHEVTSRFVPNEFIKYLGYDKITQVTLGDSVEKEVTVFFSDIRGYTSLSENMTPAETFRFVNAFNNRMGPIILKNKGFINQYLGDGIMAIFPFSPTDALNAAVEMHKELHVYNEQRALKNRLPIKVGIGLHTGPLIMGITGDEERLDATTISDTVNTAARIESLTKHYGVNILLSGSSCEKIKAESKNRNVDFLLRYLGQVQVKGKHQATKIYECFDGDSTEICSSKKLSMKHFEAALLDFHNQQFSAAANMLKLITDKTPNDKTAQLFLDKTEKLILEGVNNNWNGVETMTKK